jgi:hypothetical protein
MPRLANFLTIVALLILACAPAAAQPDLDCSGAIEVVLDKTYTGDTTGLPAEAWSLGQVKAVYGP